MTNQPDVEIDVLVSAMLDGKLADKQRERLNAVLLESPESVSRYHELLDNHEALCTIYPGEVYCDALEESFPVGQGDNQQSKAWNSSAVRIAITFSAAAAVLIAVGLAGYFLGSDQDQQIADPSNMLSMQAEQTIAGHAMLRRSVGLKWNSDAFHYRDGDVLPGGKLQVEEGIAEIEFFCGATLTVEGPARLNIKSDWSVDVESGRLRASVPPAARGFVVRTSDGEIVDLGTEFSLDVGDGNARVEVIDGEVALRGGPHDGLHLFTGQHQWLGARTPAVELGRVSSSADLEYRRADAQTQRFARWSTHSQEKRHDERLIAYFPIADSPSGRVIENAALSGASRDAVLVGPVQQTIGRFGEQSTGLEFDRIGSRARTRIDGEFSSFTFSIWVRIDSLDHVYNALFMSDGYETGELHWQIRNDGALMFSVMVDDTQQISHFSQRDNAVVNAAGLHHVYFTEPVWDISKSGRWFHIAAVYDPIGRQVTQFVNGDRVSRHPIEDRFLVKQLKIGPAEIGNWGQPFRESPWFAVRNLNGTIDELSIYDAALEEDEIRELYEQGKPLGY